MSRCRILYWEDRSAIVLKVPIDQGKVHGELFIQIEDPDNYEKYAWVTEEEGTHPHVYRVSELLAELVKNAGVKFEKIPGDQPIPRWARPDAPG